MRKRDIYIVSLYIEGESTVSWSLNPEPPLALTLAVWFQIKKLHAGVKFILKN
jgi:hypothetical protein